MSTITPTVTLPNENTVVFTYTNMVNGDDGKPIEAQWADYADRSVQVTGTLGAGGTATIEGSNASTYHALNDPNGNSLAVNALKIEQILESCLRMRPRITAGDGTTSLTVVFYCRKSRTGMGI